MKKFLTIFLTILLCLTSLFSLTACNDKSVSGDSIVNPKEKTVKVGYLEDYGPLNYTYRGKLDGFNTRLAILVFNALGYEVTFVPVKVEKADDVYTALNGTIDCFWGGLSDGYLFDSSKADFSYRYMENSLCIVSNTLNTDFIETFEDLSGKSVCYSTNSVANNYIKQNLVSFTEKNVGLIEYEKEQDYALFEVNKIISPGANFAIVDTLFALYSIKNEYTNCTINLDKADKTAYKFDQTNYLRVVFPKKTDDNDLTKKNKLRDDVNVMLKALYDTNVLQDLADTYTYTVSSETIKLTNYLYTADFN